MSWTSSEDNPIMHFSTHLIHTSLGSSFPCLGWFCLLLDDFIFPSCLSLCCLPPHPFYPTIRPGVWRAVCVCKCVCVCVCCVCECVSNSREQTQRNEEMAGVDYVREEFSEFCLWFPPNKTECKPTHQGTKTNPVFQTLSVPAAPRFAAYYYVMISTFKCCVIYCIAMCTSVYMLRCIHMETHCIPL